MIALILAGAMLIDAPTATAATAPGTVAVALAEGDNMPDDAAFADAVGQALGAADFTLLPEHSRYLAEVAIERRRSGVATAPASKSHAVVSPLAVTVPLPSHKTVLRDLVTTTLTVRLFNRTDRSLVWSGSALTVAIDGAPIETKLARAAVSSFPQTAAAVTIP